MTPEEGFESAQYLVGWAKTQFDEVEALINAFHESNPATVVKEFNPKIRRVEVKARFEPVPHKVRGLTNNIVNDLRHALDQVTSAASHLVCGTFKRNCHFPFGQSPDDFDKAVGKGPCKDIPAVLYPALKSYEPYPTGDGWEGGNTPLRLLGAISGPHKHRFTLVTGMDVSDLALHPEEIVGEVTLFDGLNSKGEYVIMTLADGAYVKIDRLSLESRVMFSDPKLKGVSVRRFLEISCDAVGHIVQDLQAQALAIGFKP